MSPSSMMAVLTMLHTGARNNTQDEMTKVLKLDKLDKMSVLQHMESFVSTLKKGSKSVTLNTANRLFPHTDKTILQEYISLVTKHFKADVKSMDYTKNPEGARLEINKWVEGETNEKIKDLLPGGSLTPLTTMVVVNAIYFKGNWATQFETKDTNKKEFTKLNADKVQIDMMFRRMKKVKYGEDSALNCKTLELPYEGQELAFVVVLPNKNDGLPGLEKSLTLKALQSLVTECHPATVDVTLPKFKLETSLELKTVLSSLGMVDIFSDNADLSGMGKELYVSEVYHKAFVDVNEEGTEAAAATAAVVMMNCIEITYNFAADHPFLFMIWDYRLHVPLFIGRFVEPPVSGNRNEQFAQQTKQEL
jgi:serpin B